MRFSLYTLMVLVLLIASIMAFVWRFPAWQLARTITPGEIIKQAWLADDGRKLVIITNKIRVFDRYSMTELRSFETQPDNLYVTASAISKRRDALAFYDKDGCVSVYSLIDFKLVFQTPPVPDIYAPNRFLQNRMIFSEADQFIVVPVALNLYNAYSLTGGTHKTPLTERLLTDVRYFEQSEIVFKLAPDAYRHDHSCSEFYSVKQRQLIFQYDLERTGWVNCGLAGDGHTLFANDGKGHIAKLDLSEPLPSSFNGKFAKFAFSADASISYAEESILFKDTGTGELYSLPNLKHLGSFRTSTQYTTRHECTEDGRILMRNFSLTRNVPSDSENFEVIDLKTGMQFFVLNNGDEQDFSTKGDAVISYDREHLKLYVRDHPEWWWGHFFRVETWLMVLFFGLLMQRLVLNVRGRLRKKA